jgi:hypothetical protein
LSFGYTRKRQAFALRHIVLCLDAIFRLVYAATVVSTPEGVSLLGGSDPMLRLLRLVLEVRGVCFLVSRGSRRIRTLLGGLSLFLRFAGTEAHAVVGLELSRGDEGCLGTSY